MARTRGERSQTILKLLDPLADLPSALASFLRAGEAKNLSGRTLEFYQESLRPFMAFASREGLTPRSTTRAHLQEFLLSLPAHLRPASKNAHLRAVKAFFGWMVKEGWLKRNPASGVNQQKERRAVLPVFSPEGLAKLLAQPDRKSFCGLRDWTLMVILADCGLRISEALNLRIGDVDLRESLLTVLGKGNKQRQVPIGQVAKRALWRWLEARGEIPGQDLVFVNQRGEACKRRQAEKAIANYGRRAGLPVKATPHVFRRFFATQWVKSGADLFSCQRILGHSSLEMVRRYAQQVVSDLQEKHRIYSPVDRMMRR